MPDVVFVKLPGPPQGLTAAKHKGVATSRGEFLVFLACASAPAPGWAEPVLEALSAPHELTVHRWFCVETVQCLR